MVIIGGDADGNEEDVFFFTFSMFLSWFQKIKNMSMGKNKKILYDPNKTEKWACVISMPLTSTSSPC